MIEPIFLASKFVTYLDVDNAKLKEQILAEKDNKLEFGEKHTFSEDSMYPDTPECHALVAEVDRVIKENIHSLYNTYTVWSHILEPNAQTMMHMHTDQNIPADCLSWVYYVDVDPNDSGDLGFWFNVDTRRIVVTEKSMTGKLVIFPDWVPHFTYKNNSGSNRISISGNAAPMSQDLESVYNNPENLYNIIGLTNVGH